MNDKLSDIGRGADPLEAAKAVGDFASDYFAHRKPYRPIAAAAAEAAIEEAIAGNDQPEPTFTLRAQDMLAPGIVEEWARRAEDMHVNGPKVRGAREIAARMREWPNRRMPD